jgi:hypothetical protein
MNYRRVVASTTLVLFAALTAIASGCAPGSNEASAKTPEAELLSVAPREITISAKNYFFVAPDTIEAGLTTIKLANQGPDLHHIQLLKLEEGHTVADLEKAFKENPHGVPTWVRWIGGPNAPVPGELAIGTIDLQPGNYALVCVIPTAEGAPHFMKGMTRDLTVIPSTRAAAVAPVADIDVKLDDYKFDISRPITAGKHTIKVENMASQPHEIFLLQLAPGAKAEDFLKWERTQQGPPPGKPMGGTTMIEKGGVNYLTADFAAGEYALICFMPDAKDGKPHFAHGMIKQITIN